MLWMVVENFYPAERKALWKPLSALLAVVTAISIVER